MFRSPFQLLCGFCCCRRRLVVVVVLLSSSCCHPVVVLLLVFSSSCCCCCCCCCLVVVLLSLSCCRPVVFVLFLILFLFLLLLIVVVGCVLGASFRVRSLVQSNDCLGAMTVGNLKNRGLDGELLSSRKCAPYILPCRTTVRQWFRTRAVTCVKNKYTLVFIE